MTTSSYSAEQPRKRDRRVLLLVLFALLATASIVIARRVMISAPANSGAATQIAPAHPPALDVGFPPWPMFRGNPALTGVTQALLPDKPKLLWTFKTGDAIRGSPAIVGNRIYITSNDCSLYALNTEGAKLWEFKTEAPIESSPCVADKSVFFGARDGKLYAIDTETGKQRWLYETQGEMKGSPNYIDGKVIAGSYDNKLHCVDAATGKSVWTFDTSNYINGAPAISGDIVAFGGCDGTLHAVSIKEGTMVSGVYVANPIAASPALYDGMAYFGHYGNEVVAADLKKEEVLWAYKDAHEYPFFSSPAVTDKFVIIGGGDKRVHCIDRLTGKELWAFTTRGKVDSSPVVAGDRILVGSDDGRIYILSMKGEELWSYEIGSPVDSSPAVANGIFLVGSNDGVLYAFGDDFSPQRRQDAKKDEAELHEPK